ncbi:hypothetical protein KUTeg_023198 [Tegillarca granosa]|uniref:Uncharacterized protein n=1 Tax=Tegillarca granosa TaxID=220873 RepID=A0ABQ9E0Y6_TEGGR|nr:hypothetical protein KUTeg_023198 [Tegillarca granosa]
MEQIISPMYSKSYVNLQLKYTYEMFEATVVDFLIVSLLQAEKSKRWERKFRRKLHCEKVQQPHITRYLLLCFSKFPNGRWYTLSDGEERSSSNPVVINNNWIEGITRKIDRAKRLGHWFIGENRRCIENIKKI